MASEKHQLRVIDNLGESETKFQNKTLYFGLQGPCVLKAIDMKMKLLVKKAQIFSFLFCRRVSRTSFEGRVGMRDLAIKEIPDKARNVLKGVMVGPSGRFPSSRFKPDKKNTNSLFTIRL